MVETLSVIIQVVLLQADRRQAHLPDGPLHHHFELGGWDEEKITLRFWIVGILAALLGRHLLLRLGQRAGMSAMTEQRTIDPDALTIDSIRAGALRGRPVTRARVRPQSGIALARFLADAGAV